MGVDSSWFRSRSSVSGKSLNSLRTTGLYYCTSVTNYPGADSAGLLVVFSLGGMQTAQIFFNPFSGTGYIRCTTVGNGSWETWSAWAPI